jgi:phospholipid/cholesterol/gamma-HCH transport system ATP-binding protein
MSDEIIALRDVHLTLGGHPALRGVSVGFAPGTSTVIMGPSGCGKSTLLKVAAGLIPADAGSVLFKGRDMFQMSERAMLEMRRINGFVFQDGALWENKTLFENLALPLQVHFAGIASHELHRRVERVLDRAGLAESAAERPAALSGGERKTAAFLRALVTEPTLLFLDEPTLSIDHAMSTRITAMIREQKARGCTIVAVTHDAELTAQLADRLVVMDEGSVIAAGEFDEVKATRNARVRSILSQLLGEIASYDTDLLQLLDGENGDRGS